MATTDKVTEQFGKNAFALSGDERNWSDLDEPEKVQWRHRGFRAALDLRAQSLSPPDARAKFKALTEEFDKKFAPLVKLKEERDKKADKLTRSEFAEYDNRIRKANEGLYEIEMERAAVARALGGRTAEPKES